MAQNIINAGYWYTGNRVEVIKDIEHFERLSRRCTCDMAERTAMTGQRLREIFATEVRVGRGLIMID